MYKFFRNFLFLFPPEAVHHITMNLLLTICRFGLARRILNSLFTVSDPGLVREIFGITFKNPVGLGAGFDKNAKYLIALECLGFGHVEIGTVTPKAQPGNEKPRLFRLRKDQALVNRMGFNNEGADQIAKRLGHWRERQRKYFTQGLPMLVGGNIGKNKSTPNAEAWQDYVYCFRALNQTVDYFVVNVSSPNTPGLRALQEKNALREILERVQSVNKELNQKPKPILLKIAPDLAVTQIDDCLDLAKEINLDGIVATNTTIERKHLKTPASKLESIGAGGVSGLPLQKKSTEIIRHLASCGQYAFGIVGSGGIFTAEDAMEKLNAGASLIQVWTGFIYEGPSITRKILQHLNR
ncbi:dihydroorotate dehydrogenase (quinone) [Candidatus Cerribacteria bacterium 'Amazon FNV 2010 28 9']|uniref:Dihydroorotate dehydrogenase (quinone) n=1 Tax=Candidatus Cerribacteria bacterium 'Amazon FNV 2010 28 9' TaxID=2081795 RepID=A0A317JQ60_9BACT|nr:MAG: dihydroorotate dehydrogenase (quinone) [Candidatus Cerribacteria bacterium 'Amazon FNV 2010 28 9']